MRYISIAVMLVSSSYGGTAFPQAMSDDEVDQLERMSEILTQQQEALDPLVQALTGTGDESATTGLFGMMIEAKEQDDLELAVSDQVSQLDTLTEEVLTLIEGREFLRATIGANQVVWMPMDDTVDSAMTQKYAAVREALLEAIKSSQ